MSFYIVEMDCAAMDELICQSCGTTHPKSKFQGQPGQPFCPNCGWLLAEKPSSHSSELQRTMKFTPGSQPPGMPAVPGAANLQPGVTPPPVFPSVTPPTVAPPPPAGGASPAEPSGQVPQLPQGVASASDLVVTMKYSPGQITRPGATPPTTPPGAVLPGVTSATPAVPGGPGSATGMPPLPASMQGFAPPPPPPAASAPPAEPAPPAAPAKPAGPMAVGKVLADRYEIQKLLGQGGMGAVYKAWDKSLKRTVAIKVMSGANVEEEDIKRFMQEGRISAALQHRNIVGFFDILSMDKLHAIVMEYVEGISFKEWLEEEAWPQGVTSLPANVRAGMMTGLVRSAMGRMGGKSKQSIDTLDQLPKAQQDGVTRVLKIFLDVCEALAYAHEKKIIHRDIKPENVMISKDGVVKLADFGLAKRQDSQSMKTLSGTIMGTPNYMSPEQASGQVHALDARSDIYSLCAVMYFAFTKTPPFQGETVYEILSRVVRDDPVPPETTNLGLPMDLSTIILKGLEKPVLNRYQAMVDLKSDIDRFLKGDTIAARPPGLMVKAYRKVRRSRKLQITCAAAALLIVGGFAAFVASSGARARAAQAALDKEQAEYADPILEAARDLAKDPPAALAKIDEAVNTAPRYANARNARCKMMYALGRPQKVLEDAQAVLDIAPENAQALYWKAMALQELDPEKNAEEVKSLLRLSAEKHSEKKLQEITLARLAFIETKYDEVLMRVNVALGMDKNLEEAYLLRGESYVRLGKTEEALRDFDNANRLNPSPAAWVARGSALAATGKDDEAFTAFDEALKLEPRHYEALYNRGRLHEFKGNPEGWAADWKAAIAAKPDHPDVPKIKEELKAKGFGDGSGAALPAVVANPGGTGAAPPANPAANPTAPPTGSASGGTSTPASAGAPDKPAAPSSGSPSAGTPPKPAGPAPKLAPQATRDEVIALLQSKEYEKAQKQLNTLVEKHAADPWLQWCYWRLMMRQAKRTEDVTNRKRLLKIAFDREQYWRNAQGFAPDDAAFADPFPQDDPIWQKIPRKS